MSWTCVAWAKNQRTGNPIRKLVLLGLAECANQDGHCWPSYQYLADIAESSTKSVERHIERLEGMGLIKRTHRLRRRDGRLGAYHYILNIAQARMALGETEGPEDTLSTGQDVGWAGDQPTPVSAPADTAVSGRPADTGVGAGTDHYGTTKEPVSEPARAHVAPVDNSGPRTLEWRTYRLDLSEAPSDLSDQVVIDWLDWRHAERKPCNQTVVSRATRELAQCVADGWVADEALAAAMSAGWTEPQAKWLRNRFAEREGGGKATGGSADVEAAWARLVNHCRRGHAAHEFETEDPALAQAARDLGGMAYLRRLTEHELQFQRRKFASVYGAAAPVAEATGG